VSENDLELIAMKSAVAFVLTVLMFAMPATQVLAQTPRQQEVPSAQSSTFDVTQEPSLVPELPETNPLDALLPPSSLGLAVALNPVDAPAPTSETVKIAIGVVLLVAAIIIALELLCGGEKDCSLY